MNHSSYLELTRRLKSLADLNGILRSVYDKDSNGKISESARNNPLFHGRVLILTRVQNEIKDLVNLMRGCCDSFVEDVKGNGLNINPDIKVLVEVMAGFIDVAKTPILGMSGLFGPILNQCRDWMDQYSWFQVGKESQTDGKGLNDKIADRNKSRVEAFKTWLESRSEYKDAVKDGRIVAPFVWSPNQARIKLARFLQPLLQDYYNGRDYWTFADNLFVHKGEVVSSKTLSKDLNK